MGESLLSPIFKNYHALSKLFEKSPWHIAAGSRPSPRGPAHRQVLCGDAWDDSTFPIWNPVTEWCQNRGVCEACIYEVIKREA